MGKSLNYYDFADNDFYYLKKTKDSGTFNAFCSISCNTVERYLKHIVDIYIKETDENSIEYQSSLRSHSIKRIMNFICRNLNDFDPPTNIRDVDGYYFSTRYPGDDSYMVSDEDMEICWRAVQACKSYVDDYCNSH